ncbi:MAG: 4-hydroxyphenylpyruvate dioxygenase [Leptolyngbyaceae cyanobacterium]
MNFEYLHLFAKNAAVWRDWFIEKLDFRPLSSEVLQTLGEFAVQYGHIVILLSSECSGRPEVDKFLQTYAEGIGDIAFRVRNLDAIVARVRALGGKINQPIHSLPTSTGSLRWCRIQGWGSVSHTLIEYPQSLSTSSPPAPQASPPAALPWLSIDHAVLNVPTGELENAVNWYTTYLGFTQQQQFLIETPRSGLRSIVLKHPDGNATLPVNEPTSSNSQIQEFIDQHNGAGIQHVALKTQDLVQTIAVLRQRGLSFLSVPEIYYQQLQIRPGFWQEAGDWGAIAQQQILVDWPAADAQTRLLQTFTQPLFDKPTFFWEFIERQSRMTPAGMKRADGFGEGNFQALFEAIEREQQLRGSLQ